MKKIIATIIVIAILIVPTIALATYQDNPEIVCPNQETVSDQCNHEEEQPPEEQMEEQPPAEEETPPAKPKTPGDEITAPATQAVEVFEGK